MTSESNLITAAEAAWALEDSERRGFQVRRVVANVVRLATPAAALNAADYCTARGIQVRAEIVGGQWAVVA